MLDSKFKKGLVNQVVTEYENIKNLREEFISVGADKEHIEWLETTMCELQNIYFELTRKED